MNKNNTFSPIGEELIRIAKSRKIGTRRFRFPIAAEAAYQLIGAYVVTEIERRGGAFGNDPFTLEKIQRLAQAITAESPKPGVLLTGKVGNGKTTLMRAFDGAARYLADVGKINPSEYGYRHQTDFGLEIHTAKSIVNYALNDPPKYERITNVPMLGIDELGEESDEVLQYGNRMRPVVDLLESRYDRQRFTFITSNLDPEEIVEHYGERVGDRFREMLLVLSYRNHPSFRK